VAFVTADTPRRVVGDPLRLQQILFNLLGNAVKFTEAGSVRLTLERASKDDETGAAMLRVRVADTGIGLTPGQIERLFEPFVQADSSTTRRFGGTGLGLSIVRRLAEAMQGGVEVESEVGRGSTFTVTVRLVAVPPATVRPEQGPLYGMSLMVSLPEASESQAIARYLRDAGAAVGVAASPAGFIGISGAGFAVRLFDGPPAPNGDVPGLPRPWRRDVLVRAVARAAGRTDGIASGVDVAVDSPEPLNGRVLVVDDNSVNRKILARQVELAGVSTDAAASGEEALELWRKGGYDLVLADLQMPAMDGFELARRIRDCEASGGRVRTPILAVTASTAEEQEQRSRAAGIDGFITKPIGIDQLKATLHAWLTRETADQAT
jgi:CheY-like chemotaxis protein